MTIPGEQRLPTHFRGIIQPALLITFSLPLFIYSYLGIYSRLIADDYGVAVKAIRYGLHGALIHDYNLWFGRVSEILTSSIATSLGPRFSMITPALLLVTWWLGLWWAAYEIAVLAKWRTPRAFAAFLACVVLFATLAGSPQLYQSIYWVNSIFTYAASMALLSYIPALILYATRRQMRGLSRALAVAALVALSFAAAAFSEPYAAAQTLAMVVAFLVSIAAFKTYRHHAPLLTFAALCGSIAAVTVLLLAPGNTVRQTNFERASSLVEAGIESLIHSAAFMVASVVSFSPGGALAAVIFPALLVYRLSAAEHLSLIIRRRLRIVALAAVLTAFALIAAFMLPGIYATQMPPPARAYIIPQGILIICLSAAGIFAGFYVRKTLHIVNKPLKAIVVGAVLLAVLLGPILTVTRQLPLIPLLSTFAHEWDMRDQMIREAAVRGETDVRVPPFTVDIAEAVGLLTIGADPAFWVNVCAAQYYGVETLATR